MRLSAKNSEASHILQAVISSLLYTPMLHCVILIREIWVKYPMGEEGKVAKVLMARLWGQQFPRFIAFSRLIFQHPHGREDCNLRLANEARRHNSALRNT